MRLDLAATELLVELEELWPFYGEARFAADMRIEDALKNAVQEERFRCIQLIETSIAKLTRTGSSFGTNAAWALKEVCEELEKEHPPNSTSIVPQEEGLDEAFPRRQW